MAIWALSKVQFWLFWTIRAIPNCIFILQSHFDSCNLGILAICNFGCFEFYFKSCIHTIFLPHLLLARAISTFWLLRYIPLLYAFLHTSNGFPHIDLSLSDGKTLLSPKLAKSSPTLFSLLWKKDSNFLIFNLSKFQLVT